MDWLAQTVMMNGVNKQLHWFLTLGMRLGSMPLEGQQETTV